MVGNSLKRISLEDVPSPEVRLVDPGVDKIAGEIVDDVRKRGEVALREWAERFGERRSGEPLLLGRDALKEAWGRMDAGTACLLERAHGRIAAFAAAQRTCLANLDMPVPGGRAGHEFVPVGRAGCYVPGGRYPLPSSALMTVSAAAAAGVPEIWCAGPHPSDCSLAAAYIAGAEGFLACGGAQAVAALGFGVIVPRCDTVVGPGGKYAASAKRQLFGIVGTEAPAGPSELLIIAGDNADPRLASADLLAQAEHDSAATPMLICQSEIFADALDRALAAGLASLPEWAALLDIVEYYKGVDRSDFFEYPAVTAEVIKVADDVLVDKITLVNIEGNFIRRKDGSIDWDSLDPGGNNEWPGSLSRHYYILSLMLAYRQSQNPAYLDAISSHLCDFLLQAKSPIDRKSVV